MNFKDYYKPILESEMDEYDSWYDYLYDNDNDYDIPKETLQELITKYNLTWTRLIPGHISSMSDGNQTLWFEVNSDGETVDVWAKSESDINDNLYRMSDSDMMDLAGVKEEDVWIDGWECTIGDARKHPPTVYHYTTEEKWEGIQADGIMNTSYGTGLTNRGASGIFTSVDMEEYAVGTYGNVCLKINLPAFMQASKLPELDISPEPEVFEVALRNLLRHKLERTDEHDEASSDMSIMTMIVGHSIPVQFIEAINQ